MRAQDTRKLAILSATTVVIALAWAAIEARATLTPAPQMVDAPRFEVDPMWPKPLPNHWVLGNVIGVGVDSKDHVFIVHRNDTVLEGTENGSAGSKPINEGGPPAPPPRARDTARGEGA